MLHARIRTPHDAFHFIAEVNPYNLQTLRQHMRQSLREDGQLRISVAIDPADQPAFARYTARWLPQLIEAGMVVEMDLTCGYDRGADGGRHMPRAMWNGAVIAESQRCVVVEGNQYFPPDAVARQYLRDSATHTVCPWKGTASYYDVVVAGETNKDAAWSYPQPKDAAQQIANYIAFWHGVTVET